MPRRDRPDPAFGCVALSTGWLRLQRPDLLERECDGFWDEVSDIVAEGCDLANTGGADEHELQIAHQIHLLDLWSHVLVHERLIELDGEVGHGAKASDDGVRAHGPDEVGE